VTIEPGKIVAVTAYVKMAEKDLISGLQDIKFIANIINDETIKIHYNSVFIAP